MFKDEASLRLVPVHVRPLMVFAAGVLIQGFVPVMVSDPVHPDEVPLNESKFDEHDIDPTPVMAERTPRFNDVHDNELTPRISEIEYVA